MKNYIFTIGLSVTFLVFGTMATSAMAQSDQSVQPNNGFLDQPPPTFMDAPPVLESLFPTLKQEVNAMNLQIHLLDELEIGSPTYAQAHRLLLSNLNMMRRQLFFNPVALARFRSSTHPARSTTDQTIYSPDFPTNVPSPSYGGATVPFKTTVFSSSGYSRSYVGSAPTRRSIIIAAELRNALNVH
ncbi:hypothetical protein AUJ46_05210 [Candidatus Peregrinibacteria bacterium CG1_02_54_53]|nr:MAG: hypothetical protein AUJ46_05210 [Candidatus Peregrinibacteria bacterium CG1_02_54_53]